MRGVKAEYWFACVFGLVSASIGAWMAGVVAALVAGVLGGAVSGAIWSWAASRKPIFRPEDGAGVGAIIGIFLPPCIYMVTFLLLESTPGHKPFPGESSFDIFGLGLLFHATPLAAAGVLVGAVSGSLLGRLEARR